ncbi:MAG TPA: efflux RND transporter periplasmic adaptor subunit [Vicinamibacteria bacterium]|nr:efflux RND transporter periplasmic adaptor subunit [Vicinamibacteria bacterium]
MRVTLAALLVLPAAACGDGRHATLILASGHVEATDVRLSAKVGGRLRSFEVNEGDAVKAGQELARIDTTDLGLLLAQARAERDQAAAELRLRLKGARAEDIAELEAQAAAAAADRDSARRDFERLQALLDRGSGTEKARDDARTRLEVTSKRLAAAEQSLLRARTGFREEEKDAARARLAALEARIAQIDQQVRDAVVSSPLDGVVTEKIAEAGELLAVAAPLAVVSNLAEPWLTVYVGEPDLGRIRLGQEADVTTDDGQTRKGRITFISPKAEFTPKNVQTRDERVKLVYKVKIGLENRDGLFKPGMPAEASLKPVSEAAK